MTIKNQFSHTFLDWDTEQLGIPTAKITSITSDILANAKQAGIKLLYFIVPESDVAQIKRAKEFGGILVDNKITYLISLKNIAIQPDPDIKSYADKIPSEALIALAYESGLYSRFRADPNLTEQQFKIIYKTWMTNSVNHSIADDVLTLSENDQLLGMVTVGEKNGRGDIGLLAVSELARGKNIGTRLVKAAQYYFIQKNYSQSQVVTQQTNIPACKLYEKCGYHVEKTECFFHMWL
ncbi:MAG TPA: GNAT family N-acetyltransferase [Gammaproteobacteria bacterium]|nr:GNAT family N-acetyltransferase [Gammaproteobacteria bacterium]